MMGSFLTVIVVDRVFASALMIICCDVSITVDVESETNHDGPRVKGKLWMMMMMHADEIVSFLDHRSSLLTYPIP